MALATATYYLLKKSRRLFGLGDLTKITRYGVSWDLDLREGIDLSIFLTGSFQKRVAETCIRLLPPGGIVFDIGANMGSVTVPLSKAVSKSGKIFAIEPTLYPFIRLKKNLAINGFDSNLVVPLQLFLSSGVDEFIPSALQSSWKVSGDNAGAHPVHLGVPQSTEGAVSSSLDSLVNKLGLSRLDLIKIDVDGAEDDVLAGGADSIICHKPSIVIEVAPYTLVERNLHPLAPLLRLQKLGYKFATMNGRALSDLDVTKLELLRPGQSIDIVAIHSDKFNSEVEKLI